MSFFPRSANPRWMRITSAATAMTFTWVFVLSVPAISLAQEHLKTKTKPAAPKPPAPWKPGKRVPPPASLKQNLTPLTDAQILKLPSLSTNQNLNSRRNQLNPDLSLFDIAGHLIKSATPAQISQWTNTLKTSHSSEEKARLHLWLGEVSLSHDSTESAKAEFALARKLVKVSNPIYGVAKLDTAYALYTNGRYGETADTLKSMLKTGSKMR